MNKKNKKIELKEQTTIDKCQHCKMHFHWDGFFYDRREIKFLCPNCEKENVFKLYKEEGRR